MFSSPENLRKGKTKGGDVWNGNSCLDLVHT